MPPLTVSSALSKGWREERSCRSLCHRATELDAASAIPLRAYPARAGHPARRKYPSCSTSCVRRRSIDRHGVTRRHLLGRSRRTATAGGPRSAALHVSVTHGRHLVWTEASNTLRRNIIGSSRPYTGYREALLGYNQQPIMETLGIDFGRVIQGAPGPDGAADTSFLGSSLVEAVTSPATPGAFEVISLLVARFEARVWIISKCGESTQRKTLAWLDHQDFYGRTGVPYGNIRFCRRRAEKAVHCEELGITHMIDDRLDVHRAIREVVPHRYLFGPQDGEIPDWVFHTSDWSAVDAELIPDTDYQGRH